MATEATLGGFTLVAEVPVTWSLTQGTQPHQQTFLMERATADALLAASSGLKPVELVVKVDGFKTLNVKNLYVLSAAPARSPFLKAVLVGDARFKWSREHVVASFNVRRSTGIRHIASDGNNITLPQEKAGIQDVQFFAKYSMKDEKLPWTVKQALTYVMSCVCKDGFDASGYADSKDMPLEGLQIDDDGPAAMRRILDYVPGLECFMGLDGITRLTQRTGGDEQGEINAAGPDIVGPPRLAYMDLANVRPSSVEVYFTPEDEVRFDFTEATSSVPVNTVDATQPRTMQNVLRLPDPFLKFTSGPLVDKTVYGGTWVPLDQDLLNAWNADTAHNPVFAGPNGNVTLDPLSFELIQRYYCFPGGMVPLFEVGVQEANFIWGRRWNAIKSHYRQTYRINPAWTARLRSIIPFRVAIVDPTNNVRMPSDVYMNYTQIPSFRRWAKTANSPMAKIAECCTPKFTANMALSAAGPAPTAIIQVVDHDQGIVHVLLNQDAWGEMTYIPSDLESACGAAGNGLVPSWDMKNQGSVKAGFMGGFLKMTAAHSATIVFTVVSASPNTLDQLYKVTIKPDDAKKILPLSISTRIGQCLGPVWKIRVGAGTLTAKFAWQDDGKHAQATENAILKGLPRPDDSCINLEDQVKPLATAYAAGIYAILTNHTEGSLVTAIDPGRQPVGKIKTVRHELDPSGVATTSMGLPPDQLFQDPFSLLPESTRRTILGMVGVPQR